MTKYFFAVLFQVFFIPISFAQLCTGSLGDPVVNITFGNAASPKGPLKSGVTNLLFTSSTCPKDGEYTITKETFGCFSYTWHLVSIDHTGDIGGRFMLINASPEPSEFYVDTVTGLCGSTTFEFATWVTNVLKPTACNGTGVKPNLTFSIETTTGLLLKKFNSGDISGDYPYENIDVWRQFGTFFTTPPGVNSVVLRIINNSPGGSQCGNDLALDDITFRPCGPKVNAYESTDSSKLINICENNNQNFHFNASYSNGFTDPVLQWQMSKDSGKTWIDIVGEQGPTFTRTPTKAGQYQYRVAIAERSNVASASCRISSNVTIINVRAMPLGPSYTEVAGCTNGNLKIAALQGYDNTYLWTGPNAFSSTLPEIEFLHVQYADSGLYQVTINALGCIRTDSFYLKVFPGAIANVSAGANICEGSSTVLTASGGIQYNWSPAIGLSNIHSPNPIASPKDTTQYKVIVTNQYGCKDSALTTVNVWKKPFVNAGPDKRIFEGETVLLQGMATGTALSFSWSPTLFMQNSNSLTPTVSPEEKTRYTLTGRSTLGCGTATDEVLVNVYKKIIAPNAFSPNADGINDTWIVKGLDSYPEATVRIFNRYGLIVFFTRSVEKVWDGNYNAKPLPVGVYYYQIDLHIGQPILSGSILMIR